MPNDRKNLETRLAADGDDALRELLQRTDANALRPQTRQVLGEHVRARAMRRRRAQFVLIGSALPLVVLVLSFFVPPSPDNPLTITKNDPPSPARELAQLQWDEYLAEQTVKCLEERPKPQRIASHKAMNDPQAVLSQVRNRAAFTMLKYGDALTTDEPMLAIDAYRRTHLLFPDTAAADQARARLVELGS